MRAYFPKILCFAVFSSAVAGFAEERPAGSPGSVTLEQSFRAALAQSEIIGTQVELIVQAEERYRQAFGAVLPNVSLVGQEFLQQNAGTATALYPASQPLVKLTATQPLFRGLREFAALKQTTLLKDAQTETARQARVQLWHDVNNNFYTVLSLERDLANIGTEIDFYDRRIKDLNGWLRIGRARATDVLTTSSSVAALRATVESTKGLILAAREVFAFETGLPRDTQLVDEMGAELPALANEDVYIEGLKARPDVKSTGFQLQASEKAVDIARGAYLPSADFLGNYYLKRFGPSANVDWDVQFTISLPLYAGGTIDSGVRVAASQLHQTSLLEQQTRRAAAEEIRTYYANYQSDLNQVKALKVAADVGQRNYRANSNDFKLGLVTNLDVLTALTSYEESTRALDKQIFTAKADFQHLEAASNRSALAVGPEELGK